MLSFTARREADTQRLGRALAEALPDGTTIALIGTLGAGKTRLVQAVAAACNITVEDVVSPTFTLCHEYRGTRTIYHLDAYRVKDDDEFLELGVQEFFDSPALTFVEWGDRVANCLPRGHLTIEIKVTDQTAREFVISGNEAVIEAISRALAATE